jgi:tetratricopeptide (TPR) repeat protein
MSTLASVPTVPQSPAGGSPDSRAALDESEAWYALQGHLEWSVDPTILFLFVDDPGVLQRLRERAVRTVQAGGGRSRLLQPEEPQSLREVVRDITTSRKVDLVWLEAISSGPAWANAWSDVLGRLNEGREKLRKSLGGVLVVAAPRALKSLFRNTAPDLWSIHSLAVELATPGSEPLPDRRAERTNAYRIAEAALRAEYHERMHEQPWFALVLGDDPTPRRRMMDALVDRGFSLLVHAQGSSEVAQPTEMDLHWVLVEDEPPLGLLQVLSGVGAAPSRPVILEGPLQLEHLLARRLPELYQTVAFVVRLQVERALHPGPLPVLDRAEETVKDVWGALDRARALLGSLPDLAGKDEAVARSERVRQLIRAVEALLVQGWTTEASALAREALQAASELAPTDPDAPWLEAEVRELMGKVAQQLGHLEAMGWYESALPIRRHLARTRTRQRTRRRSELARCLSELGGLALSAGHEAEAERYINEALAIRRRLAGASEDRETLPDLATSWSLKGDLALARGQAGDRSVADATEAFREALRLRERVAAEEDTPRFRRLLSVAHGRLSKARARAGDWVGARRSAERAVALARALTALDPNNPSWRSEASVAASRLGDCARALGDLAGAAAAYRDEVELRRRLSVEQPESARVQELCAVAYGRLAEVELELGQLDAAHDAARRAMELSEALAFQAGGHASRLRGLATAWLRLGDVLLRRGETEQASAAYQRVEQLARSLLEGEGEQPPSGERRKAVTLLQQLEARGRAQEPAEIR